MVQTAAVYATIHNAGGPDRLLEIKAAVGTGAELHRTSHSGDMAQMRAVGILKIPAHGEVAFEPGGLHLMLTGLLEPLQEGQRISLTFEFEKSGSIPVEARVLPIDSSGIAPAGQEHAGHHHE